MEEKLKYRLTSIFIIMILQVIFQHIALANQVKYVYRVDYRHPEDIFANGFSAWGDNASLRDHIMGISPYNGNSAYISTTSIRSAGLRIAYSNNISGVAKGEPRKQYLYRIRADDRFYDVYRPLDKYVNGLINDERTPQRELELALGRKANEAETLEYVNIGGIRANQIIDAVELTFNGNHSMPNEGLTYSNQNYRDINTTSNPIPLEFNGPRNLVAFYVRTTLAQFSSGFFPCSMQRRNSSSRSVEGIYELSACEGITYEPINCISQNSYLNDKNRWSYCRNRSHWYDPFRYRAEFFAPRGCSLDPGGKDDVNRLVIYCKKNPFWNSYTIYIRAYGDRNDWVRMKKFGNSTGENIVFTPKDMNVLGTNYTLDDYGYTINETFGGLNGWYSKIRIHPTYDSPSRLSILSSPY